MIPLLLLAMVSVQNPKMMFDPKDKVATLEDGLLYADVRVGTGEVVTAGSTPIVDYTLHLEDGTKVDSSKDKGRVPFKFTVGRSKVIKGWHLGLIGMREGGVRKLKVPYELGYGETGRPPIIPAKAVLWFTIELRKVTMPAAFTQRERVITSNSGLQFVEITLGKGKAARAGDQVTVHYTLYSPETDVIDTSQSGDGKPLVFVLGARHVVAGFDEAVMGMKVGSERKVRIPPTLGYGESGAGPIGSNQVLWFSIQLIGIK